MSEADRLSTGIDQLDHALGGGLIPGTLTVVLGSSGIGKTQLGLQFAHAGRKQEGRSGVLFDMSARIDSQSHAAYARRMFDWSLAEQPHERLSVQEVFDPAHGVGDYLHVFEQRGRRVTERDLGFDGWHDWQAQLAARLELTIAFFYGNFIRGVRRVVIDGIEPVQRQSESIQYEMFEYVYHQVLRKEAAWVARDLLRESFRANEAAVERHDYDFGTIGAVLLATSHETMLEPLIERPMIDGDLLATANTVIYMGKLREGSKISRALFIAKHRGSACSDEIIRYRIDDAGLRMD